MPGFDEGAVRRRVDKNVVKEGIGGVCIGGGTVGHTEAGAEEDPLTVVFRERELARGVELWSVAGGLRGDGECGEDRKKKLFHYGIPRDARGALSGRSRVFSQFSSRSVERDCGGSVMLETVTSGSNSVVECQLPKLDVAGSTPVSRSSFEVADDPDGDERKLLTGQVVDGIQEILRNRPPY